MAPALLPGDEITVRAVSPRRLGPGDIIVFSSDAFGDDEPGLVVHRLVWRDNPLGEPSRLYTKGDARERFDPVVTTSQVLGRVVGITREGRPLRPAGLSKRIRCVGLAAGGGLKRLRRMRRRAAAGGVEVAQAPERRGLEAG